jgi:membrane protease YdiL (CAAX protease family)
MTDQSAVAWLAWPFWNPDERRPRALWRLAGFFLMLNVLVRLAAAAGLARGLPGDRPVTAAVTLFAMIMASLWTTAVLLERRPLRDSGLHLQEPALRELLCGLALGALLMTGIFLVELALGWVTVTGRFRSGDPGLSFGLAFLKPLLVFLCVGIYEEAASRGFLLRMLAEGLSSRWVRPRTALVLAAIVSSALFGLGHRSNPHATIASTIIISVAGLFLALPYLLTGRLALPIGLHITWNLFQGNVFGFPVSGTTSLQTTVVAIEQRGPELWTGGVFGPEAGMIGLLATGVGSVLIFVMLRDRNGRAEIQETLAAPPPRPLPPPAAPPAEPEQLTA